MGKKINLFKLLDEDGLTTDQERTLRSMLSHECKKVEDGIGVFFRVKGTNIKSSFVVLGGKLKENRSGIYKQIMVNIIYESLKEFKGAVVVKKVKILKKKQNDQELFKAIQLLKKAGALG